MVDWGQVSPDPAGSNAAKAAAILADRLAQVEAQRDQARALAIMFAMLTVWRTPSMFHNPESLAGELSQRGIAICDGPRGAVEAPRLF